MKVQYVGRKPVPVLVGVELKHIQGDVFETDTPEILPACFKVLAEKPPEKNPDQDPKPEADSEPKSSKKSRKRTGGES